MVLQRVKLEIQTRSFSIRDRVPEYCLIWLHEDSMRKALAIIRGSTLDSATLNAKEHPRDLQRIPESNLRRCHWTGI